MLVGLALIAFTPLKAVVEGRAENQHSNEGREFLYVETIKDVIESPIIGYGGPRPYGGPKHHPPPRAPRASSGWCSSRRGSPARFFFVAFLFKLIRATRRGTVVTFWCHVTLIIALVQIFVYDMIPVQLHLIMVVAALGIREATPERSPALEAGVGVTAADGRATGPARPTTPRSNRCSRCSVHRPTTVAAGASSGRCCPSGRRPATWCRSAPAGSRPPRGSGPPATALGQHADVAGRRLLVRSGGARLYPFQATVGAGDPATSLVELLRTRFDRPELQVAVALGRPRPNRKPVLQLIDGDGTTVGFGKVGIDDAHRRARRAGEPLPHRARRRPTRRSCCPTRCSPRSGAATSCWW